MSRLRPVSTPTETIPDTLELIEGLRRFDRLVELHASSFYAAHRAEIDRVLSTALGGDCRKLDARPPASFRVVQWNIEKGLRFDGVADALALHGVLSTADVILLNEVDLGMARSGNRNIALQLAERLGMAWVFAPAHLELTKGVGAEVFAEGENAVGLQGNAILSRFTLTGVRIVPLANCFEPYHFHEKRYGGRVAVMAQIETAAGPVTIVGTHLEVRNTPGCRARQARDIVRALGRHGRAVLGGDLNCGTFPRGTVARTVAGVLRLIGDVDKLRAELRDPRSREPLFLELRRAGLVTDGWNTDDVTIVERLDALEDAQMLPRFVLRAIARRLDRMERKLPMRLDWFAGRGVAAASPRTIGDIAGEDGARVSDHDPIVIDVSGA